jgi:hypothetical protein
MAEVEVGTFNLTYPITFHPYTFKQYNLPLYFGGILETEEGTVSKVPVLILIRIKSGPRLSEFNQVYFA